MHLAAPDDVILISHYGFCRSESDELATRLWTIRTGDSGQKGDSGQTKLPHIIKSVRSFGGYFVCHESLSRISCHESLVTNLCSIMNGSAESFIRPADNYLRLYSAGKTSSGVVPSPYLPGALCPRRLCFPLSLPVVETRTLKTGDRQDD